MACLPQIEMSVAKRAYDGEMIRLRKVLKRPLLITCEIMPSGFTDADFVNTFKGCFAGMWQTICDKKMEYDEMDRGRIRKHFKPIYCFPSPSTFLLETANNHITRIRKRHMRGEIKSEEERVMLCQKHLEKSLVRKHRREVREKEANDPLQLVDPEFSNYFIKTYFDIKHRHPEDVDSRMRILEEAAKFKCAATIAFMRKVNSAERNFTLRYFAFETLQKTFGFSAVLLHRNRKGKHHLGDTAKPSMVNSPGELVAAIYESQNSLERHKVFHVFLSHSMQDHDKLIRLKALLNSLGLSVYLDWAEDRAALRRNLTNADTARVIIERMKNCKSVMYVRTSASLASTWAAWELGYAHALQKKICVLNVEDIAERPAFLNLYDEAVVCGEDVMVCSNGTQQPIKAWLAV